MAARVLGRPLLPSAGGYISHVRCANLHQRCKPTCLCGVLDGFALWHERPQRLNGPVTNLHSTLRLAALCSCGNLRRLDRQARGVRFSLHVAYLSTRRACVEAFVSFHVRGNGTIAGIGKSLTRNDVTKHLLQSDQRIRLFHHSPNIVERIHPSEDVVQNCHALTSLQQVASFKCPGRAVFFRAIIVARAIYKS